MNKITNEQINSVIKANAPTPVSVTVDIGGESITFDVRPRISAEECLNFVNGVVSASFSDNATSAADWAGSEYVAFNEDLFFDVMLLHVYAGIPMVTDEDPNGKTIIALACCYDLVDAISSAVNSRQRLDLYNAVLRQIEYRKNENLAYAKRQLDDIVRGIQESIESIDAAAISGSMADALEIAKALFPDKEG